MEKTTLGTMLLIVMIFGHGCASYDDTVGHVNNTLEVVQGVPLDQAWAAVNQTLRDQSLPVIATEKDGGSGRLESRTPKGKPLVIQLLRQGPQTTEIDLTIGTGKSAANWAEEQKLFEQIKTRF